MTSTGYTASPPFDDDAPPRRSLAASRVWAGAILLLAGLGLIVLGGCFLIGVVAVANPALFNPSPDPGAPVPTASWDPANLFLFFALNILALACFLGAAALFVVGFLGLWRILFGERKATA